MLDGFWQLLAGWVGSPEDVSAWAQRINPMQIGVCKARGGGGMCVGEELSVRTVSVLEWWKAVVLIT